MTNLLTGDLHVDEATRQLWTRLAEEADSPVERFNPDTVDGLRCRRGPHRRLGSVGWARRTPDENDAVFFHYRIIAARFLHPDSDATAIRWSSDGRALAVGRLDGSVQVWSLD